MSRSSSNGESDFEAGELVLAMHHGHLYKAKVKNVGLRPRDKKAGGPKVSSVSWPKHVGRTQRILPSPDLNPARTDR